MKRHLNTLFVATQGAYLRKEREAVVVRVEGETRLRVPIHNLEGIVCFGNVSCSPFLMGLCGDRGVHLSFLSERGRFLARVHGVTSGNVLLRRTQYRWADDETRSAALARSFILAKITNTRAVLQRAARDRPSISAAAPLRAAAVRLGQFLAQLRRSQPLAVLRGIEGGAARSYFGVFDQLITQQKASFSFAGRTRRPPTTNVNALLSFVYVLLRHDAEAALEAVGLDPAVGFLHRDRPGRSGLALDLMEEFRASTDRLVLSLINLRRLRGSDFKTEPTGGVSLSDKARRLVLTAYQDRKREELTHPFLGEKTTVGMLVHLQARLLARHLRGDMDAYPPFIWK